MVAKLKEAELRFEDEPYCPVTLDDGTLVGGNRPDLVMEHTVLPHPLICFESAAEEVATYDQ